MSDYVVTYDMPSFPYTKRVALFSAPANATWRELQQIFDPTYYYNLLKFYNLGSKINLVEGK